MSYQKWYRIQKNKIFELQTKSYYFSFLLSVSYWTSQLISLNSSFFTFMAIMIFTSSINKNLWQPHDKCLGHGRCSVNTNTGWLSNQWRHRYKDPLFHIHKCYSADRDSIFFKYAETWNSHIYPLKFQLMVFTVHRVKYRMIIHEGSDIFVLLVG